jgi:hypothetical protein
MILHLSEQIKNGFTGFAIDKCKRLFTFHIDNCEIFIDTIILYSFIPSLINAILL